GFRAGARSVPQMPGRPYRVRVSSPGSRRVLPIPSGSRNSCPGRSRSAGRHPLWRRRAPARRSGCPYAVSRPAGRTQGKPPRPKGGTAPAKDTIVARIEYSGSGVHKNGLMAQIDDQLMASVDAYVESLYGKSDPVLDTCLASEHEAGMRLINVSPNQGKLIYLIARMCGVRRILEIGTLAGYSTIWMARALPLDGRLVSLEFVPLHAEVARRNIERAGLASKVEIRVGPAADTLRKMTGEAPFDLVFIDANKSGYPE